MLSDEVLEKVTERIVERISTLNTNILKHIGSKLDEIGTLNYTQAQKLVQTLKYGGDYNKIVNELAKISKLNTKEIKEIFEEVAKNDYMFAKQFYDYREIGYIPFEENVALQNEVKAIANITARRCAEMMTPRALGFGMIDKKTGEVTFKGLKKAYYDLLDEAVLSVNEGKETFDTAMSRQIKQMGGGGLKVIYESTYINKDGVEVHNSRRLDSAIRMNLKDSLRELHNETQAIFGEEFKSDGVEISVHGNPAPDHELVQGRQFSNAEFNKFQNDEDCVSYDGIFFPAESEETGRDRRSISEYNCYHYTFSIVLGVSKPEYSNEQLQEIIDKNNEGFEIDGKHYTMYEGTQMQRSLETEIRKQKDIQIMAKASGQDDLVLNSQQKITQLTQKYKELSNISGLPTKMERAKVSGYRRIKIEDNYIVKPKINARELIVEKPKLKENEIFISKETQQRRLGVRKEYIENKKLEREKNLAEIPKNSTRAWDITMRKIMEKDINKYNEQLEEINTIVPNNRIIKLKSKEDCQSLLKEININLKNTDLDKVNKDTLISTTKKYYELVEKYPFLEDSLQKDSLNLEFRKLQSGNIGEATIGGYSIGLNTSDYRYKDDLIYTAKSQTKSNYNMPCSVKEYINYFSTHEMGHVFNYRALGYIRSESPTKLGLEEFMEKTNTQFKDTIMNIASKKTGKSETELLDLFSDYSKKNIDEAMAELFANANCGKPNALGEAFDEYFKELLK